MSPAATTASDTKRIIESTVTSGFAPEQILRHLDSYGVDWYLTDQGDLMIKYWQIGAEGFVSPEHVGRIRAGRPIPSEMHALEWVSAHIPALQQRYGGQWIAVVGEAVIASADNLPQLLEKVQASGVERPFVTEIPTGSITWDTAYARSHI
jgi:hypothetical protein